MSSPVQTCQVCGDREWVVPDGRGFPPDIAKRKLAKRCKAAGHNCDPLYTAGLTAYTAFLALVRNGFRPPTGPGRCRACACHVATQGHRDGCPERGK